MELQSIHCFLVHRAKGPSEQPNIGGTPVAAGVEQHLNRMGFQP